MKYSDYVRELERVDSSRETAPPAVGDVVLPAQWAPPRGRVVGRDIRGDQPGSLVRWHPGEPARWVPDGRLVVVDEDEPR